MSEDWDSPIEGGGEFIRIAQLAGHLIIAYPIGYIEHMQTRFSTPDKRSDAIVCDIVDLDVIGDDNQPGKVYRSQRFMQGQVIVGLRSRMNGRVLGRVGQGVSRNGMNAPWQIQDATQDPDAVARAMAWAQAHPDFKPSEFVPYIPRQQVPVAAPQPPQQQYPGQQFNTAPPAQYPGSGNGYGQPQQPTPWPSAPPAQQPQYQQPVPGWQQQGYGVGPSPQGPPPEWAVAPQQASAQSASSPMPQQMGAALPAVPVAGSAQVAPSVLERMRAMRAEVEQQHDPVADRQQFGF